MVGYPTIQTILRNKLVPDFLDHYMAKYGIEGQLTNEQEDPHRKDNLWEPVPGDPGTYGDFKDRAQDYSTFDQIYEHKKVIGVFGVPMPGVSILTRIMKS